MQLITKIVEGEELALPRDCPARRALAAHAEDARVDPSLRRARHADQQIILTHQPLADGEQWRRVAYKGVGVEPECGGVGRARDCNRLRHVSKEQLARPLEQTRVLAAEADEWAGIECRAQRQRDVDIRPRALRLVGRDALWYICIARCGGRAQLRRRRLEQLFATVALVVRAGEGDVANAKGTTQRLVHKCGSVTNEYFGEGRELGGLGRREIQHRQSAERPE